MIYEFAVNPEGLNTWDTFRYVFDGFGVDKGRLISQFPAGFEWPRQVLAACDAKGARPVERMKVVERLQSDFKQKSGDFGRRYDSMRRWIDNALSAHQDFPFRAILHDCACPSTSEVLECRLLDESNSLWDVPHEVVVPRTAKSICACVAPLIRRSLRVLVVDPYFDPLNRAFVDTFAALASIVFDSNASQRCLEIHCSVRRVNLRHQAPEEESRQDWERFCQTGIAAKVPRRSYVTLVRWRQRGDGDKPHPRYLLTERGGIRVEPGFENRKEGETADISLLDATVWQERWWDYQIPVPAPVARPSRLEFVDAIRVDGLARK